MWSHSWVYWKYIKLMNNQNVCCYWIKMCSPIKIILILNEPSDVTLMYLTPRLQWDLSVGSHLLPGLMTSSQSWWTFHVQRLHPSNPYVALWFNLCWMLRKKIDQNLDIFEQVFHLVVKEYQDGGSYDVLGCQYYFQVGGYCQETRTPVTFFSYSSPMDTLSSPSFTMSFLCIQPNEPYFPSLLCLLQPVP